MVNVFVVGAAKSGTSWLYQCFKEHPLIFVGDIKEHNQFTYEFENGFKEYDRYFSSEKRVKVDISPSYLADRFVPERLHKYNSSSKIVMILRSPVERSYSHYCMLLKAGIVGRDAYKEITESIHSVRLLGDGYYYSHLTNYLKYFQKEQIGIFFYKDLKENPMKFLNSIFLFLDLDLGFEPEILNSKFHSAKNLPRSQKMYNLLTKVAGLGYRKSKLFRMVLNKIRVLGIVDFFHAINKGQDYPSLSGSQKLLLSNLFKNDICRLEKLLERDLSDWYNFQSTEI